MNQHVSSVTSRLYSNFPTFSESTSPEAVHQQLEPLPPSSPYFSLLAAATEKMTVALGKNDTSSIRHKQKQKRGNIVSDPPAVVETLPLLNPDSYITPLPSFESSTTLAELAHSVKLQTYQEQKHLQSKIRLYKYLVANTLSIRLTRTGFLCHTILVDLLKADHKKEFATLYNSLYDVRNSFEATRKFALLEPELDTPSKDEVETPKVWTSWIHEIPTQARETILSFVSMIRSDPSFLASRLAKLSTSDLENLAKFHQPVSPPDSVIASPRRGSVTNARSSSAHLPPPIDRLLAFHRNDPLYTLLHSIFANSMGPDSAEDKRRTDVWATACAKLLTESKGCDQFLFAVLDSWAAMREWPALGNLEVCLMSLLQEGAFLLDKPEDQHPGKSPQDMRGKIDLLTEEFHTRGVKELFKVLDDEPSAGGIPEGVLELGHAILEKIDDPKKKRSAEFVIAVKWFFGRFLTSGLQYPEYHGIMTGYHISEHARLKILRPIAQKAAKAAYHVMWVELKQTQPVEPVLRQHVENIIARFRSLRSPDTSPVLVPSKTVTSPPETAEVQPFIVLCPADIVTLCNALYPINIFEGRDINKRLTNRTSRPLLSKSTASGGFEMGSSPVISSNSSVTSEGASIYVPLLDRPSIPEDRVSFGSAMPSPSSFSIAGSSLSLTISEDIDPSEKLGADIRSAVEAMIGRLSPEVCGGRCHPCAEKWSVFFLSQDGKQLSLKMTQDWDDDDDEDEEGELDEDSEDEGSPELSGLNSSYDQIKEIIKKLIDEYEIPEEVSEEEGPPKKFSNRTHASRAEEPVTPVSPPSPLSESPPKPQFDSNNPYHKSNLTAMFAASQDPQPSAMMASSTISSIQDDYKKSPLVMMLTAASQQCLARGDFVSSQQYHRALSQLKGLPDSLKKSGYGALIHILSRGARTSIDRCASSIEEIEAWFVWLTLAQERQDTAVEEMMQRIKDLRDKMWYVTDVRNSAAYEEAKSVSFALKKMGQPVKPGTGKPATSRSRNTLTNRITTPNMSLLKSDSLMDLLAAPIEHGGPNKLSDEQADITFNYLSRFSVENFCKGEERIHRFCYEIDKCVNKLVGDGILDGPVLWSSELYSRDDRELASGKQKGELYLPGVGTLAFPGEDGYETDSSQSGKRSFDLLRKPSTSDLFARSRLSSAGTDIPSSRARGRSKSNPGLEDISGGLSSLSIYESTPTFWSPFTTSTSRPRTSHSPALIKPPETVNKEKRKFLTELKQSLTGLLLSDLGVEAWSQGSETDAWFNGGLGDECIQRKEEQEAAIRKKTERSAAAKVAEAKAKKMSRKKSTKNLRKTATHNTVMFGMGEKGEPAAPVATLENAAHDTHSGEENSSSSDATARAPKPAIIKKGGLAAFPYNHAFRRLLQKFSMHPNPFQKLHALFELELLIVASLSSTTPSFANRRGTLPNIPTSPLLDAMNESASRISSLQLSQANNIEEAISNIDQRRTHVINNAIKTSPAITPTGSRSPNPVAPSTDMIVDVLQTLFRQADIRPKTLFRDLQFVAAFVPASVLDMTEIGKAFWDTGLAALGLKQDVCRTMVEIADEIVVHHTKKRGVESKKDGKNMIAEDDEDSWLSRFSMKDAADMWTISAKEGDPTAQRELAIFYLTNPSLVPRVTKPLSKPKDTFRPDMMVTKGEDPEKRDPATMCVSLHWMELSSQGGDELAKKYLKQQEGW